MTILPQLEENKGTVSSALGKSLARQVLAGQTEILEEAVLLLGHGEKNVRAGAAKIIEQVAATDPTLVTGYLSQLLPALEVDEPQTRWMAIHTLGLCAALDITTALAALPKAKEFIRAKSGACLWGATVKYLGYVGATSETNARTVLPILEHALDALPRQTKQVLEALLGMINQVEGAERGRIANYVALYAQDERPSVKSVARKIQKKLTRPE